MKKETIAISNERAQLLIKCLARKWDSFEVEETGFLSILFEWRLIYCIKPLLKFIDKEVRYSFICSIFEDQDIVPNTLAILLNYFESEHGRFSRDKTKSDIQIIDLEQVIKLEQIFKIRAVDALDSGMSLNYTGGLKFLWLLEQIHTKLVEKKKKILVTDDISLIEVLGHCISKGSIASRIVSKTRTMHFKYLEEFIDIKEAFQRINIYKTTEEFRELTKDDQLNIVTFLLSFQSVDGQDEESDCIFEDTLQKELEKILAEI